MLKILILGYVWPEPNSSAAGTRIMELIRAFNGAEWQVHFASAASISEHQADLSAVAADSHSIALNCSSFNDFVRALAPDIVVFDRYITEEQFGWRVAESCPQALRVLDTEDLHSLRLAREMLHKKRQKTEGHSAPPVSAQGDTLYRAMLAQGDILREVAAILRSDISLIISDREMSLLQQAFYVPDYLLYHLPFMLTPPNASTPAFSERRGFISIGNFRHAPNWDAVLWLKHILWPAIRARLPGAELSVCGAYPPPKATALHNKREGFLVTGWVDDARHSLQQHRVCLAPLRFGAGMKGKLVDAMQTRTPSVTTAIGAEGMHGELHWPGVIADSVEAIVEAAVHLHEDYKAWQQASDRAQPLLHQRYHGEQLASQLTQTLAQLHSTLAEHRQRHFLGQLLNHHTLRSSEFMSRWIEAKSRL